MDLREFQHEVLLRHPWETSRIKAVKKILSASVDKKKPKVLDIGCGDCFAVSELFKESDMTHIDAVDINLTESQAAEFSVKRGVSIYTKYEQLRKEFYDIIFLMDVIEHLEPEVPFLKETIDQYSAPGGMIFITVPAFNVLYGSHDSFLGHHRRYNMKELKSVIDQAGLNVIRSGYLFFSLLVMRFTMIWFQRITRITFADKGVGAWKHGTLLSQCIEAVLMADNNISLFLNNLGVRLPGLTAWALCKKRQ